MIEQWRHISKFYQVSNKGRVRSLDRTYTSKSGKVQTRKGKIRVSVDAGIVMQHYQKLPGYQAGLACGYRQTTISDGIEVIDPMDS